MKPDIYALLELALLSDDPDSDDNQKQ